MNDVCVLKTMRMILSTKIVNNEIIIVWSIIVVYMLICYVWMCICVFVVCLCRCVSVWAKHFFFFWSNAVFVFAFYVLAIFVQESRFFCSFFLKFRKTKKKSFLHINIDWKINLFGKLSYFLNEIAFFLFTGPNQVNFQSRRMKNGRLHKDRYLIFFMEFSMKNHYFWRFSFYSMMFTLLYACAFVCVFVFC